MITPARQGLSFQDSYAYLDDWVLGALGDMGIKAWYQPLNDIATDQGKIAGAAQKRVVGPGGGPGARRSGWTRCAGRPVCRARP
ncbi:hypothetical protein AMK11_25420 [Streptomyces sp. CB02414]|nr:hypothetical protein AMK11_25420 [Streptomyces sp. CB02414]